MDPAGLPLDRARPLTPGQFTNAAEGGGGGDGDGGHGGDGEPAVARNGRDVRFIIALATGMLWHGAMLLGGSYQRTYDAYIHMFFGDHYARDWFSTWETRWYTGFPTTSYPPGTHQLIAILSGGADGAVGLELAFVIIQLASVLMLITGVYRFSQIWVSCRAAGWAALLAVTSTSIAEVVHVFGQLPTSFSLAILLNTLPSVYRWVADGHQRHGLVAVCGLAATTAGHHVTTLFGAVFFVGPTIVTALIDAFRRPRPGETAGHSVLLQRANIVPVVARRLRRLLPAVIRAAMISFAALVVLVVVVLPYWLWSSSDPIVQIPIPHASRDNLLENTAAGIVFFAVPWGLMILLLPVALVRGFASRAVPLASSALLLFVLGTGGTTPIPRLLLRGAFDILTLDRFTIWSTIAILPLAGWVVDSAVFGRLGTVARSFVGRRVWQVGLASAAISLVVAAVLVANFSQFRPLQPDRIDPEPVAAFMTKDQHDRWRYLTLGFGDQMAIVGAHTTATTVDGNYHSARRLPELTSRSVERLEGAKFRGIPGIGSLQQFLATPERYNLKFVFSNDVFYDPLLWASGWHRLDRLVNGVMVWEREDIPPLPDVLPTRELPGWQRLLWGTAPLTAMTTAALVFGWTALGQRYPAVVGRVHRRASAWFGRRWIWRTWHRLDLCLARSAARTQRGDKRSRWLDQVEGVVSRAEAWIEGPRTRRSRLALLGSMGMLAVLLFVATRSEVAGPPTVEETVLAYYDDLDFQRFEEAWQRLDDQRRPTLDQYLLELSVQDGLVGSYGKLDSIEVEVTPVDQTLARASVDLGWITSVLEFQTVREHELINRNGTWSIVPAASDVSTTPDQFSRSTSVDYLSQGRRQVTTERSLFGDVLDRPRLQILSARTVVSDGRFTVVGELTNLDVDPADVTISAEFKDENNVTLVAHNAALVTVHKVLPRETVPFRIDLEEIAGLDPDHAEASGDFHPELFAAPQIIATDVARVELASKAVVTGRELDRSITVQHLRVERTGDGLRLRGELLNQGTRTATMPHVLVTLLREDGSVGWVDHLWVPTAVRPQRTVEFAVSLTSPTALEQLAAPMQIFGNGLAGGEAGDVPFSSGTTIDVPGSEWAAARVNVASFFRSFE